MVRGVTIRRRWRTAFATSIGTSHLKTGTPCQDLAACQVLEATDGSEILVAAVSDGAGTASRSDAGSSLAVGHFLRCFSEAARSGPGLEQIDRAFVDGWLADVRSELRQLAEADKAELRDYACTLLGIVVGPNTAAYVQIGDGAIVVSAEEPGEYDWIFWPQHGEFANSTFFITQDGAEEVLQFEIGAAREELAAFSDGIERLVLDMKSTAVHSPAFRPIFEWLAGTEPDRSGAASEALVAYLGSDHVNRRTDDDKTLVMATRAVPSASA